MRGKLQDWRNRNFHTILMSNGNLKSIATQRFPIMNLFIVAALPLGAALILDSTLCASSIHSSAILLVATFEADTDIRVTGQRRDPEILQLRQLIHGRHL